MWRCRKCNSNLLDETTECPVCKLPAEAGEVLYPAEIEPSSKFWFWLVIGVLIPPIGLLVLLVFVAQKLTPNSRDVTR